MREAMARCAGDNFFKRVACEQGVGPAVLRGLLGQGTAVSERTAARQGTVAIGSRSRQENASAIRRILERSETWAAFTGTTAVAFSTAARPSMSSRSGTRGSTIRSTT